MSGIPLVDLSIQYAQIGTEVATAIDRIASTGAFVQGPDVKAFEAEFADFCGAPHCVGVANGTDALELAMRAVGVGHGDEVILPANTFVATAGAVMRIGAVPVLVDCDPDYLLMDVSQVESRITARTKAIAPVHLYGQTAFVEQLMPIAEKRGIAVIEDAAQSQGAARHGRRAGSLGTIAGTSFYPGKNLGAYGDAGAVVVSTTELEKKVRLLGNHGSDVKYQHPVLGYNSRLDTIQAVVLRAKLRRLDAWNQQRRDAADLYARLLSGVPGISVPQTAPGNEHVWHLYVVRVPERDRVLADLNAHGIGAGIHYPVPVHLHGAYSFLGHGVGDFPVAEGAADEILSLPLYPGITADQQEIVAASLVKALRQVA